MAIERGIIRPPGKSELRLRIPAWVMKQLQEAAIAAGADCKPAAVAAAQILEDWARDREASMKSEQKQV